MLGTTKNLGHGIARDKKRGVSGVKRGSGIWVFIRLWKVYPEYTLCIRRSVSRIRKEEGEERGQQCIQGEKGQLYMGQLRWGKCIWTKKRKHIWVNTWGKCVWGKNREVFVECVSGIRSRGKVYLGQLIQGKACLGYWEKCLWSVYLG